MGNKKSLVIWHVSQQLQDKNKIKYRTKNYMKNFLKFRWIVLPLMLMVLAVGNVRADVNDLSIIVPMAADSIVEAQDFAQETSNWHAHFNQIVDDYRFEFGILASMAAAIFALVLFFSFLRPRLKILPIVAYHDVEDKKTGLVIKKCRIAIKNNGLSPCNDIRVEISKHLLSEYDVETRDQIEQMQYLSIAGRLSSDNLSTINVDFDIMPTILVNKKEKKEQVLYPRRIIVEVLAQNAISGIISPARLIFSENNFQVGKYVNTTFIEQGDTYKQAIMKSNFQTLKSVSIILGVVWAIASVCIFLSILSLSILKKIGLVLLILALLLLCTVVWQIIVYTKAEAYNINNIAHIVKNTIIELHQHKHFDKEIKEIKNVEDVEPIAAAPQKK